MIAASSRNRMRFARGNILSSSGSTHGNKRIEESLEYIRRVFQDYFQYGRLSGQDIEGKILLELGPGDNAGVALMFLAHGARRVYCLDKFYPIRDPERERRIYQELRKQLDPEQRRRFDDAIQLEPELVANPEKLELIHGRAAGEADRVFAARQFDIIFSRAVLEEVFDTDGVFAALDQILRPGGVLLHKIDLGDYGAFSQAGIHPLEFLTIPDWIYRWIADDGRPNRRTLHYYRSKMKELHYTAEIFLSEVIGRNGGCRPVAGRKTRLEKDADYEDWHLELVREIRPRLAAPFRHLDDEDLLVAGIFLVARKP